MSQVLDLAAPLLLKLLLANGVALVGYLSVKIGPAVASFIVSHVHSLRLQSLLLAVAKAAGPVVVGIADTGITAANGSTTPGPAALAAIKSALGPAVLAQLEAVLGTGQVDTVLSQHLQAASLRSIKLVSGQVVSITRNAAIPPGAELVAAPS